MYVTNLYNLLFYIVGHASFIGAKTKKLIGYEVRCKKCAICDTAGRLNIDVKVHDCRKNWNGSAKAMEPDMAVSMLKRFKEKGVRINKITMDDDSTTIARARTEIDASLIKQSDKNHTNKNLTRKLYALQKNKNYKSLKTKTISHLQKCFAYAIASNEGKPEDLKRNLEAITPHVFGDHSLCDSSWCGYLKDEIKYRPKNLPYGKYLQGDELKRDISKIFEDMASQYHRLSSLGCSQANENFNHIVASKAKKSSYFGGSESLSYRVAAAGCQKNKGHSYIVDVSY